MELIENIGGKERKANLDSAAFERSQVPTYLGEAKPLYGLPIGNERYMIMGISRSAI